MNTFQDGLKKCTIDSMNTKRQANHLVVYTHTYGKKTGTNALGTEVVVENNLVISKGSNNNVIPPNGFVLSGTGLAKDWLDDCIVVGSHLYLDEAKLTVTYS